MCSKIQPLTLHFITPQESITQENQPFGIAKISDPKFSVYIDLPVHTAPGEESIPPELCLTALKPDIVILDNNRKNIHLFELTCPGEKYIETRHIKKSNKYAYFQTDITEYL